MELDIRTLAKMCLEREKVDSELNFQFLVNDMQIVPSLGLPNTFYLFTHFGEKKFEVLSGEILETSNLTEYELKYIKLWI